MPVGVEVEGVTYASASLKNHVQHAAALGRIVANYAQIEAAIGGILGLMMKADMEAAIVVLSKIKSSSAQIQTTRAVAESTLAPAEAAQLNTLLGRVSNHAERRNKVAHGLWGAKASEPDTVYRLPLTALAKFMVRIPHQFKSGQEPSVADVASRRESYTLQDLLTIEAEGEQVHRDVMTYYTQKVGEVLGA